jgi:hypothetical protein
MIYRNAWQVNYGPGKTVLEANMQIDISRSTINLARDGLIALRDAAGTRVFCQAGSLWITQEGEVKDAVLDSGEAFTVRNGGLTVITALRTSALALLEAPSAAPGIEPDVPHRFKASAELVACN